MDWPQSAPAAWPGAVRAWLAAQRERARANRVELLVLLGIVLIAMALRFVGLGAQPDIVSGDEGRIGTLGLSTLNGEIVNPFITTYGHSTMYLFLEGAMQWLTGLFFGQHSAVALRALHAVVGVLTVPVVYLLGRDLFDRRVGLVAAGLLTVSHFHIHFSRIIVAAGVVDALLTGIAVWLFWRGLRSGRAVHFVLSGLLVGAHLYFYMGGRVTFMFLLAYIVGLYLIKLQQARPLTGHFLAFAAAFLLIGLPMIHWATAMPAEFMARYNQVGIYGSGWLEQQMLATGKSQLAILAEQLRDALLAFTYYPAFAFYMARLPLLDYWTSVPFVLGLVYALWRTLERRFLLLNAWFWSAIVGGQVLVMMPSQAAYRTIILVPVVFLLAAFVLVKLGDLLREALSPDWLRRGANLLLVAFLVVTSVINVQYYFGEFSQACSYEDTNTRLASHWAKYLATLGRERYTAYLLGGLRLMYGIHPSWDYLTDYMEIVNVNDPVTGTAPAISPVRSAVFLFLPERQSESPAIERAYPNGTWLQFGECGQVLGYAYELPPLATSP
jgi:4-amino-4-deoxy-L-arabinose transferase-like glycosyltransferase